MTVRSLSLVGLRALVVVGSEPDDASIAAAEDDTATAVCAALRSQGVVAERAAFTVGALRDLGRQLRSDPPDVVVNLCESPGADARSAARL